MQYENIPQSLLYMVDNHMKSRDFLNVLDDIDSEMSAGEEDFDISTLYLGLQEILDLILLLEGMGFEVDTGYTESELRVSLNE